MPTLTASAPASISALVPSAVATLPAITCTRLDCFLMRRDQLQHPAGMTVRGVDHHQIDTRLRSAARRAAKPSSPTLVAAATRSRPCSSLQALGYFCAFSMSLTVIRPMQRKSSSTTSSFSIRCWCSRRWASSRLTPSFTVTSFLVISSETGVLGVGGEAHVAVGEDADQLALACRSPPPGRRRSSSRPSGCRASASVAVGRDGDRD